MNDKIKKKKWQVDDTNSLERYFVKLVLYIVDWWSLPAHRGFLGLLEHKGKYDMFERYFKYKM